jgi:hypothetical protein
MLTHDKFNFRAGNCDMKGFNAREGENWLVPMLLDVTRCECTGLILKEIDVSS